MIMSCASETSAGSLHRFRISRVQDRGRHGNASSAASRRRGRCLPRFEALEARCTPTTLPAGFTEAAVATGIEQPHGDGVRPRRPPVRARAGGERQARPGDGTTWTALHLNVDSQGERGLLGIAFDPAFASEPLRLPVLHQPGSRRRRPGRPASTTSSAGSPSTTPTRPARSSRTRPRSSTGTT